MGELLKVVAGAYLALIVLLVGLMLVTSFSVPATQATPLAQILIIAAAVVLCLPAAMLFAFGQMAIDLTRAVGELRGLRADLARRDLQTPKGAAVPGLTSAVSRADSAPPRPMTRERFVEEARLQGMMHGTRNGYLWRRYGGGPCEVLTADGVLSYRDEAAMIAAIG